MSRKKLLVLNGSHSEIPLIVSGRELGFRVITTGNDPSLIGHKYADEYIYADFSNREDILALAVKVEIDAICSCANDFGAITASYVAEKLAIPGHDSYETSLTLHRKDLFKIVSKEVLLTTPDARSYSSFEDALFATNESDYPLVIKPVDLTGGKGVCIVNNDHEYKKAANRAFQLSRAGKIVVESFFGGSLHSFSAFVINRKVRLYFTDNEFSYINPYLVTTSAAPSVYSDIFSEQLVIQANKLAKALNLVDGVLHFQYLANDGNFTIIEITRRCSGDLYPYPVQLACNIDWARWIVMAEAGMDCGYFPHSIQSGYCGRHCIMSHTNGIVKEIIIDSEIENNIYKTVIWGGKGYHITDFMCQKLGVVILRYNSNEEMLEKTKNINQLIRVKIA